MPRKLHNIKKFEGGINDHSDQRDIKNDQLTELVDCDISNVGKIINPGKPINALQDDGTTPIVDFGNAGIQEGKGLYTY